MLCSKVVTGLSTCLIVSKEVGNTLIMFSVFVHMLRMLIDWFLGWCEGDEFWVLWGIVI